MGRPNSLIAALPREHLFNEGVPTGSGHRITRSDLNGLDVSLGSKPTTRVYHSADADESEDRHEVRQ